MNQIIKLQPSSAPAKEHFPYTLLSYRSLKAFYSGQLSLLTAHFHLLYVIFAAAASSVF